MVDGAVGHMEEDAERMVKTPWYDYEIPFTQAAELGTYKVIHDHSTIGIVITTDGSFPISHRQIMNRRWKNTEAAFGASQAVSGTIKQRKTACGRNKAVCRGVVLKVSGNGSSG